MSGPDFDRQLALAEQLLAAVQVQMAQQPCWDALPPAERASSVLATAALRLGAAAFGRQKALAADTVSVCDVPTGMVRAAGVFLCGLEPALKTMLVPGLVQSLVNGLGLGGGPVDPRTLN